MTPIRIGLDIAKNVVQVHGVDDNGTVVIRKRLRRPETSSRVNSRGVRRQAIITQLVNRAAIADFRAIRILFDIVRDIETHSEPASAATSGFTEADEMAHLGC